MYIYLNLITNIAALSNGEVVFFGANPSNRGRREWET